LYLGVSFADATISGVIDQAYYTSKITSAANAQKITKGIGSQNNGTSEFTISGAEDLTGGMKATYAFNVQADIGGADSTAFAMRRSHIGLKGDFGSIKLGNQWTPAFFVVLAADPTALVSSTGAGVVGASKSVTASTSSITYALPTLVSGLAVSLQSGQGESASSAAGNNNGGSLTYSSGALMAAYAYQKLTAGTGATFTTSAGAAPTYVTSLATLTGGTSKISSSVTTVTYDLGMVKLHGNQNADKITGTTSKVSGSLYGISIPVGDTTIGLVSTSSTGTDGAGTQFKEKGSRYAVFHALSKRTTAYAFMGKSTLNGATTAHAMTAFGLQHGF
jgi:predicted porin